MRAIRWLAKKWNTEHGRLRLGYGFIQTLWTGIFKSLMHLGVVCRFTSFSRKTPVISSSHSHLCVDLLLENVLQGDSVCGELADALGELVHGHGVLVEVEAEVTLVRQVALLLNVQR